MLDNLQIINTLRAAGFDTGEINVNAEPGVRDVTITGADRDTVTGESCFHIAAAAARALAAAGYDILCYGRDFSQPGTPATLMVRLPKTIGQAA